MPGASIGSLGLWRPATAIGRAHRGGCRRPIQPRHGSGIRWNSSGRDLPRRIPGSSLTHISSRPVTPWSFDYRPSTELPALAWVARIADRTVDVAHGTSVRTSADAFFDGTWVGGGNLPSVLDSTTTFGAGMVARKDDLYVVPAAHTCEGVYICRPDAAASDLLVSNSIVALLEATGLSLVAGTDYVSRF